MTSRALKLALVASVAINLFAVVGVATVLVSQARIERHVDSQRRMGRTSSLHQIVDAMDPVVRDSVRTQLRASALAARPDFEEARDARREAVEKAGAEPLDRAAVDALLQRSLAAEMRGRGRLESDAVVILATLQPADRQALSVILSRHTSRGGKGSDRREPRRETEAATPLS